MNSLSASDTIILASASPRRQELLRLITDNFECIPADVEEIVPDGIDILKRAEYLAEIKCKAVAKAHRESIVIGSDTVVIADDTMLGKPKSVEDAFEMLRLLQGREHIVVTGCCICKGEKTVSFSDKTAVEFYPLTDGEILEYIKTNEPFDKAGAYGIQGKGALLVKGIRGDYYNVMGLPVALLYRRFREFGIG